MLTDELHTAAVPAFGPGTPWAAAYPDSAREFRGGLVFMADAGDRDVIVASGARTELTGLPVEVRGEKYLQAELTHENAAALRDMFPFCAPVRILGFKRTIGLGDRLGIASPGHIRAMKNRPDFRPVLAQQSIRELTLTHRTFDEVLDSAAFAVYREGYEGGYGADGDHLKNREEVALALRCGYTMITLDCSEKIDGGAFLLSDGQVAEAEGGRGPYSADYYLGRTFSLGGGISLAYDAVSLKRAELIYGRAIGFMKEIYFDFIKAGSGARADYEISIDEIASPSEPLHHFFIASELARSGVEIATLAPRFCGEFQKGVDYRGDTAKLDAELRVHAAIARHFGYKLSIHSGSDKFSAFPYIGRETEGRLHIKTAGTSWLEAMKIIAAREPALYRRIHKFALGAFKEAAARYHVSADPGRIPDAGALPDSRLTGLFGCDDARQLIHITYGQILNARGAGGGYLYRDALYAAWRKHAAEYRDALADHIGRHMNTLLPGSGA